MSGYFQRLVQQSNLRVHSAPVAPPSPTHAASAPVERSFPIASHDPLEIHESVSTLPSSDVTSAAPRRPRAPDATPLEIPPARPPAASPAGTAHLVEEHIVHETVSVVPGKSSSSPSPRQTAAATASAQRATESVRTERPSDKTLVPPIDPREALQAVMRWIAAGQPPPGKDGPTASSSSAPASNSPSVAGETVSETKESLRPAPSPIPERVIETIEHWDAPVPPPRPAVELAPRGTSVDRVPPAAAPEPAQVSIGSVHVRIESPPVAAPPRRVEPPRAEPTPRAGNFSRLRRHYILPH